MTVSVFVYGTLEIPLVRQAVLVKEIRVQPAVLHGYRRALLRGKSYPGIVSAYGRSVCGTLCRDLDADDLDRLDRFEDDVYQRQQVEVESKGKQMKAFAYVIPAANDSILSEQAWDRALFEREHLEEFLGARG